MLDSKLIEFWRKHECLFNSSIGSYFDKDLKARLWEECSLWIGKSVSDVMRRATSLRTQYGRIYWKPEHILTIQQKMLKEKLDFLRPFIVRRRNDRLPGEEDDDEDEETEGSFEQETGSMLSSPVDNSISGPDPTYEPQPIASTTTATLHPSTPQQQQPQVTEGTPMNFNIQSDEFPHDLPARVTAVPNHNVLNQFTEVMLADMCQIKDQLLLMRLRRDITDLVFKAVLEDEKRQRLRPSFTYTPGDSGQFNTFTRPQDGAGSQMNLSYRQRYLEKKHKRAMLTRSMQRRQEMQSLRRMSRCPQMQSVQQGDERGETSCQSLASELKPGIEAELVKIEEVTLPVV